MFPVSLRVWSSLFSPFVEHRAAPGKNHFFFPPRTPNVGGQGSFFKTPPLFFPFLFPPFPRRASFPPPFSSSLHLNSGRTPSPLVFLLFPPSKWPAPFFFFPIAALDGQIGAGAPSLFSLVRPALPPWHPFPLFPRGRNLFPKFNPFWNFLFPPCSTGLESANPLSPSSCVLSMLYPWSHYDSPSFFFFFPLERNTNILRAVPPPFSSSLSQAPPIREIRWRSRTFTLNYALLLPSPPY